MCRPFTTDCWYDNSTKILIEEMFCSNTMCSCKLCLHKMTIQPLGRRDYQCSHCKSLCQVHNILFEGQTNSFFLSFSQGVYIFQESPKPIQDVIRLVYCPGKYCPTERNANHLGLCNNYEVHLWLWKRWSLVNCSQSSFYITRARKDNKNRQNTLFLC